MATLEVNGNVRVNGNMYIHGDLEIENGNVIVYSGDVILHNGVDKLIDDSHKLTDNPVWFINNLIIKLDVKTKKVYIDDIEIKNSIEFGKIFFEEMERIAIGRSGLNNVDFFNY